ncbi:MAG TPA: serpin family protein [Bradyrhizobium sp.]|uniref:serpin family protein n=1 Tax=Bradyrhizobium sp. TaxID=376 RepID=UPI002C64FA2C|nr:serpin family protein [Bradyrhizobium sp.]HLZ03731.1 serpin family protein [Bradyrhizobium sp.]
MKPMWVQRRWLLKGGFTALLGLIGGSSLADVLVTDNDAIMGDDGVLAAQMRLGGLLIRHLAGHKEIGAVDGAKDNTNANVVVSPASLAAILSLVDLGASPAMRRAIHRALGFKRTARHKAEKDLREMRRSVSGIIAQSRKDGPLVLANLVAFDRAVDPKPLAMYGLSGAGADVLVDHLADAKVVDRINGWVKQKTHDLIPTIISEAPETLGLVAINALYFKDKWQTPFRPSSTQAQPFQTTSGKPVEVQMMHSKVAPFRFRQDDRFVAAELGYQNKNFRLVVATTKSVPAPAPEFAAVAGWLNGQGFEARDGEIALPKLTLSAAGELLPALDALGLAAERHSPDALEGFSDEPLTISRILQKIELRVSEEGTEGAAATAVMTTRGIGISDHIRMVVDKPFVFALRDEKTGLILFMGYVGAPPRA